MDSAVWHARLLRVLTPHWSERLTDGWRYSLALAIVAAAVAFRWVLIPILGTVILHCIALPAIIAATVFLGAGPGFLSLVLLVVLDDCLILGSFPMMLTVASMMRMGVSFVAGVIMVGILHATRLAAVQARQSEARLATFVAAAFEGIVESEAGRILDCNEQFARLTGYDAAELRGMLIAELIEPEDQEPVLTDIRLNRESTVEHTLLRKDGTRITVETHGRPLGSLSRVTAFRDVTTRNMAVAALRESEERYRTVVEHAGEGVWTLNEELNTAYASARMAEMFGYAPEEMVGRPVFDFIAEEDWPKAQCELGERMSNRDYRPIEFPFRRKDGSTVWMLINSTAVEDEAGHIVGAMGLFTDITDRKLAEEEMRRQQRRLEEEARINEILIESIPGLFYLIDSTGHLLRHNRATETITGYSAADLAARTSLDYFLPEDRVFVAELMAKALLDGEANADLEFIRRDSHHLFVAFTARRVEIDGMPCLLGTGTDITARKIKQEELEQSRNGFARKLDERTTELDHSEARYRELVENLADVVFEATSDGIIIFANAAVESMLGFPVEEARGLRIMDLVHPDDLDRATMSMREALAGRSSQPEVRIRHKDGTWRWVSATTRLAPVSTPGGDGPHLLGTMKDITELRFKDEQLRQAQRLESVGRLAGGVAHDFNNLLAVIISYAGFALEELHESDPIRVDILEIRKAGERAAALTRQLLAFSRKQILEPCLLDIGCVISDLDKMLRRLIGEDIDISLRLQGDLGSVMADPGQIEQVIVNLCVNARDAMPNGGRLTIETADAELDRECTGRHIGVTPGPYVMMSITDTGCGMDEGTRGRIFEPFFTTKEKGRGTGLGLATVYGIVKQSGGDIWVYSEPGLGTTFKIYLPRVDVPGADIRPKPAPAMATGSETVLIVEDEAMVRNLTSRILRKAGYTVLTAANGGDALLLMETHGVVDLLITDVVMPQMSGRDLAERLAGMSPGLKVLFMSGYTDNAIVHHGVLDPGTRFIGKPFTSADLTRKVRETLDGQMKGDHYAG